ncbi:hypothetical protein MTO96_006034 [Rhipicephalus appendiculatus]
METAEGLEDNNASIDDPIYANRILTLRQETLIWDDTAYLDISPGENITPQNLLYDEHAEELSFPQIYYGHPRRINPEVVRVHMKRETDPSKAKRLGGMADKLKVIRSLKE